MPIPEQATNYDGRTTRDHGERQLHEKDDDSITERHAEYRLLLGEHQGAAPTCAVGQARRPTGVSPMRISPAPRAALSRCRGVPKSLNLKHVAKQSTSMPLRQQGAYTKDRQVLIGRLHARTSSTGAQQT